MTIVTNDSVASGPHCKNLWVLFLFGFLGLSYRRRRRRHRRHRHRRRRHCHVFSFFFFCYDAFVFFLNAIRPSEGEFREATRKILR